MVFCASGKGRAGLNLVPFSSLKATKEVGQMVPCVGRCSLNYHPSPPPRHRHRHHHHQSPRPRESQRLLCTSPITKKLYFYYFYYYYFFPDAVVMVAMPCFDFFLFFIKLFYI